MRAMPKSYGVRIAGFLPAFLLASVGLILLGGGAVAQAAPARPRVAVMSVAAEQLSAEVRAKIEAAVAGGLAASGADVVDSATTARGIAAKGLRGCDTSTCRMAIAEATGTGYLVRGSVESMGRSYTVRLEMIDGATGGVIGAREDRCEICTESEAYETASVTASALKAEVLKRPVPPAPSGGTDAAPAARPLAAVPPPGSGSAGETTTLRAPAPSSSSSAEAARPRFSALSWIGVGGGAAAMGAGAVLVYLDGHGTCGEEHACPRHFTTRSGGMALIGIGALAAALGATALIGHF
jgi:TolB-like protein